MKYRVQDLEYTRKMYGNYLSMKSVIIDEQDHIIATSPFGSMNEDFKVELDKCSTKEDVITLTDKHFYNRLFDGICRQLGVQ